MHARHLMYEARSHSETTVESSAPLLGTLSSDERRDVVVDILASTIPEIDLSDVPGSTSDRRSWSFGPASPWKNKRERRRGLSYLRDSRLAASGEDRADGMPSSKSLSNAFDALAAGDSATGPKLASPPVFYETTDLLCSNGVGNFTEDDPFALADEPSERKSGTNSPWKTSPWKTSPWKARQKRQAELASSGFLSDDAAELSRQNSASMSGAASLPPLMPKAEQRASSVAYSAFDQKESRPAGCANISDENDTTRRRQRQRNRVKYGFSPSRAASLSDVERKPANADENV